HKHINTFITFARMKKLISWLIRYVPRKYLQRVGGSGLKLVSIFYVGSNVACPVCTRQFRKFLPYGRVNPRANALCPNCLSLERHRLLWLYLQQRTDFFNAPLKVLHFAPEACFLERFEKLHGDGYITADIESPLAKLKVDIHNIPLEDNTFDVVLCNHVLEHVADDIKAMKEIHRVLKPGGFSILQVPFFNPVPDTTLEDPTVQDPRERERLYGQRDHVRKYGHDYTARIEASGLKAVEDDFVNTLSEETRHRFGLVKGEVVFRGEKQEQQAVSSLQ
ncbi:MAG TPA: class I SAM-dependent methyltransferase, partial [Cyclobacteriaceae bacterium]|nr:class I SAM-dependent methyltransferase [Cyclobacteriaceae bacterium]